MARVHYDGLEVIVDQLEGIGREAAKSMVMAAAEALVEETKKEISDYHHVDTGNMRESVRAGNYQEFMGGGRVEVYPQGNDSRGVDNAKKAFIVDAGIGSKPRTKRSGFKQKNKTGDHFLTKKTAKKAESVVEKAMLSEWDRILRK